MRDCVDGQRVAAQAGAGGADTTAPQRTPAEDVAKGDLCFPQAFADAVPVPVLVKDTQGRYLGANRAMLHLSGLDAAAFRDGTVDGLVPEAVARRHGEADREVIAHGATVAYHMDVADGRGGTRRLRFRKSPWCDAAGAVQGIVATIIEDAEVARLEGALAEQNRQLSERLKELRCLYDVSGILLRHRSSPADAARDVATRLPAAFMFPELASARIELRHGVVAMSGNFDARGATLLAPIFLDGREAGCIQAGYPATMPGDEPPRFLPEEQDLLDEIARRFSRLLHNFDDRKRVADSEARFRATFAQAAVGICRIGLDGSFMQANDRFLEMTGYAGADLGRLRLPTITEEADAQDYVALNAGLAAGEIPRYVVEKRFRRSDDSVIWCRLSMSAVRASGTRIAEFIGVFEDITAARAARDQVVALSGRIASALRGTVDVLSRTQEMQDPYTSGHQRRVTELSLEIGRRMGLDAAQLLNLEMGAMIHDVGKLSIPTQLLTKPGKLGTEEFRLIRTHAAAGWNSVAHSELPGEVAQIVRHHHERWDGSGYPDGLAGLDIPVLARIVAVADTVEAITSHRPYRAARGLETALNVITEGRGRIFDADVVDICVQAIGDGAIDWTAGAPRL